MATKAYREQEEKPLILVLSEHLESVVQTALHQCSRQVRAAHKPTGQFGLLTMAPITILVLAASQYCCSPDGTLIAARIKKSLVVRDMKINRRSARNVFYFVAAKSVL